MQYVKASIDCILLYAVYIFNYMNSYFFVELRYFFQVKISPPFVATFSFAYKLFIILQLGYHITINIPTLHFYTYAYMDLRDTGSMRTLPKHKRISKLIDTEPRGSGGRKRREIDDFAAKIKKEPRGLAYFCLEPRKFSKLYH